MILLSHQSALYTAVMLDLVFAGCAFAQSKSELKRDSTILWIKPPSYGSKPTLTLEDVHAIETEGKPTVVAVAPIARARTNAIVPNRNWVPMFVYGTTPKFFEARDWKLDRGRIWTDDEQKNNAEVCVLGKSLAKELFDEESPIGKSINLGGCSLKVIGTLASKGKDFIGLDQDDLLVAPLGVIQDKVKSSSTVPQPATPGGIYSIYVRVADAKQTSPTAQQIAATLRKRHGITTGQPDDFKIDTFAELARVFQYIEDTEKVQGTWTVVAMEANGKKLPEKAYKGISIGFMKDSMIRIEDNHSEIAMFGLYTAVDPNWIDTKSTSKDGDERFGIYQLNGDDLKICFSKQKNNRPKEFATKTASGHELIVLKRKKE